MYDAMVVMFVFFSLMHSRLCVSIVVESLCTHNKKKKTVTKTQWLGRAKTKQKNETKKTS